MPDEVCFAAKPPLAAAMPHWTRELDVRARRLTGDEVDGSLELRRTTTRLAAQVPAKSRMWMRTGHGMKGHRHYDWALIEVRPDDTLTDGEVGGHAFLVVRRHRYTRELSFCRCHPTTPVRLVHITCTRWKIEEDFQNAKGLTGLGQGQVTCWNSGYAGA
ncbi:hypothetical protein ACFZCL_33135 [Streptomyces sp. NPDC008159]|uniref:hypothetical protein n=1 Tax=Streptomyces sp. NPDC008159 TaxID=3364817 RepID=UPI0036E4C524